MAGLKLTTGWLKTVDLSSTRPKILLQILEKEIVNYKNRPYKNRLIIVSDGQYSDEIAMPQQLFLKLDKIPVFSIIELLWARVHWRTDDFNIKNRFMVLIAFDVVDTSNLVLIGNPKQLTDEDKEGEEPAQKIMRIARKCILGLSDKLNCVVFYNYLLLKLGTPSVDQPNVVLARTSGVSGASNLPRMYYQQSIN